MRHTATLFLLTFLFPAFAAAQSPTLVQHVSCPNGRNVGGASSPTPDYICPLPEPSQAGNAILVGIISTAGATLTLSDDKGNTWNQIDSATDSGSGEIIAIYLAVNVTAGTRMIKLHRGTPGTYGVAMSASEYYNVNALDGSAHHCTVGSASTSVSAGNTTPSVSGDLVWQWSASISGGVPNSTTSFTVGSQSNIAWQFLGTDIYDGDAVQAGVYGSTATLNPTLTSGTSLAFDSCAMAVKAASAGNPPTQSFRIVHMLHQQMPMSAANPWKAQFASSGNLIVASYVSGGSFITGISSTPSNTWTSTGTAVGNPATTTGSQIYYAANVTPSNSMSISFTRDTNTSDGTFMMYDFVGAASAPFDKDSGGQTADQTSIVTSLTTCSPGGPLNCSFSPTGVIQEVVLANTGWQFCTGFNVTSPGGGLFDAATDTGVSIDGPEPADQNNGWMHYYTNSASNITVTWSMGCGTSFEANWAGRVAAFKSAGSISQLPAPPTQLKAVVN